MLNRISKFSQGLNVDLRLGLRAAYRNAVDSRYFCQGYFRFIGYTRPLSFRKPARSGQDAIDRLRIDAWKSEKAEKERVASVELSIATTIEYQVRDKVNQIDRPSFRDQEPARFEFANDVARPTIDVVRLLYPNFLFDERQGRVRFASAKTRRDAARRGAA